MPNRIDEIGDGQALPLTRDYRAGRQVDVAGEEFGLYVQRNTELGTPPF